MGNTIGSKIVLEGEKEYRQALKNINTEQKELRSEMKLCSSEFEGQQNSIAALTKKHEILEKQINAQSRKVELYTQRLEETKKAHDNAGEKIEDLSKKLQEAEKEMEAMKASSDTSSEALEEQKKKIEDLNQKLNNAKDVYQKTETAASNWQAQINNATADLNAMNNDLKNTEKYMEEAMSSTDGCASSINEYGKAVKNSSEKSKTFGDVLKANLASEAIVGGLKQVISLAKEAGEELINCAMDVFAYADNIMTMSTNTGIAAETLQELTYAQELMDVSLETVTSSMARNIRSMRSAKEGSESYAEAYAKLGVSVTGTDGKLRDSETVYWELIDSLGKIENQTERDALSMTIFGKSAQDLNSLIAVGSKGFSGLAQEAKKSGYVLSDDVLETLLKTSDAFERMSNRITATKNNIGAELAPVLERSFERIGDAVEDAQEDVIDFAEDAIPALVDGLEWIIDNGDTVISLTAGITAAVVYHGTVAPLITTVTKAWQEYKAANEKATIAQYAMNTAMEMNPAGMLVTAVVGLTAAVAAYALTTADAESEVKKLTEESREAVESIIQESEKRRESTNANEAEIATIQSLTKELSSLDAKQKLSTEEKSRMLAVVGELNEAMPELNLSINEQTGHLSENSKGWEKNADAMLEALEIQFKQEDLTAIAKERYEAEKKLQEIGEQRAKLEEELSEATERHNAAASDSVGIFESNGQSLDGTQKKCAELKGALEEYCAQEEDLKTQMQQLEEEYNSLYDTMGAVEEQTGESGSVTVEYKDKLYEVKGASEETRGELQSLSAEYEEAKEAAEESITSQVSLFEELAVKSDLSIGQMSENLQSQTDAFNQYKDDLLTASGLVEQGILDEGLLGAIQELGMDGAGYLHELATASDEEIGKVVESFREMQEAKDNLAGAIADVQTEYSDRMEELLGIQTEKLDTYKENIEQNNEDVKEVMDAGTEDAAEAAENTMDAFNQEIVIGSEIVVQSMDDLCNNLVATANTKFNIVEGKSLVFQEIGRSLPAGLAQGIYDGTSEVEAAITSLIDRMIAKAVAKIKEAKRTIDRELGDALR